MALLRMLSRAAFICNICFLLAICFLRIKRPVTMEIASLTIVMGFFLSWIFNGAVNLGLIYRWMSKKPFTDIPRWLIITNAGFLAIQIILFLL